MCNKLRFLWMLVILFSIPGLSFAQTTTKPVRMVVAGYTDANGERLAQDGDTKITVQSDGKMTTLTLSNLFAYGEAGAGKTDNGKRQAWYGSNPNYFKGGTVYALKLGDSWRGGHTAAQVDLSADKGIVVLGQGKVGDNQVTITYPSMKAATGGVDYQPMNFLLVKADGNRAWIGHSGWALTNTSAGIGDFMVLAAGDSRFPATVVGYDSKGQVVRLTTQSRAELAKVIQPPAGSQEATKAAQEQ